VARHEGGVRRGGCVERGEVAVAVHLPVHRTRRQRGSGIRALVRGECARDGGERALVLQRRGVGIADGDRVGGAADSAHVLGGKRGRVTRRDLDRQRVPGLPRRGGLQRDGGSPLV